MKMTKKGKALLLGTLTALLLENMFTVFAYREDKLYLAAEDGDLENVKCYILQGADIDAADTDGNTPLVYAAKKGHIEIVRYLVNHSADVETYGGKALIYAAEYGHLGTVKYLVEYGAEKKEERIA